MELHPDWNEFLSLLTRHGVRFIVVGAHALAAHGRPRYTGDLDVLVDTSIANARRLAKALTEFGFAAAARSWRRLTKPYQLLVLGSPPVRIDVLTSISGVSFREAWSGRIVARTTIGDIPALGLEQLRRNKAASGRPKDHADLAMLDEVARAERATTRTNKARRKSSKPARKPSATRTRKSSTREPSSRRRSKPSS